MSVRELEEAVSQLPPEELETFARWFDEFRAELWDEQIEQDIRAGRLDELGRVAEEDFEAGRCTPL